MHVSRILILTVGLAAATGSALAAQTPVDTSRDSTRLDEDQSAQRFTYGVTAGGVGFRDGRTQQSVGAVLRLHLPLGFSLAATPAAARVQFPSSLGSGSSSGLTDLPVELNLDRDIPNTRLSLGGSFAASLPVGDTATGFGSGAVGYSVSGGVNLAATDKLSLHAGAGRPLTDFSFSSALGGASGTWVDAEASYQLTERVGASLSFDGDLASGDSAGPARAIGGGLSIALLGPTTLTLTASHGVSGLAPRWQTALGLGTDFAWIGSLASSSPLQRVIGALAGQSRGKGRGRSTTSGSNGRGHGP